MGYPDPKGKPVRPIIRWLLRPLAFAWLGVLLTAPLILVHEIYASIGLVLGFLVGIWLAISNPRWLQRTDREREQDRRKPVTPNQRIILTVVAVSLSGIVVYALQESGSRGILFFFAALLMVSFSRRALRRAWGLPGSAVGMALTGSLLFLIVRAALVETGDEGGPVYAITGFLLLVEAFDELRGLKRMNAPPESEDRSD